jgi:hypothetical protein
MLTSAAALAFFRRLRFGIETINPETGRTYLEYTEPCAFVRADQDKTVLQDLYVLSSRLTFSFVHAQAPTPGRPSPRHNHHFAVLIRIPHVLPEWC